MKVKKKAILYIRSTSSGNQIFVKTATGELIPASDFIAAAEKIRELNEGK